MSVPPAYASQPPVMSSLPSNANEHCLSSSLPPYSSQLPENHITIPSAQVAAMVPTNRPPQTQVPQPIQPQQQVVQYVTPPQVTMPQPVFPQMIQPQPQQQQVVRPLLYSAPYCLTNDTPNSSTLPAGPYFGPIPYPFTLPQPPYLPSPPPQQTVLPCNPPLPPCQPQVPIQLHQQPQLQHQLQQQPIMHQGIVFQEHGFPGPGSLPPGGKWAVTTESDGRKTLWTMLPGETRPSGWAYD
ncbi:hypothetical protein BKA64DRAFT_701901 [Cadophora sp. MPI-SDFR-AT-0126]|nr:hypothetical protein BKA64DRAFT_701901 [Leotiomycetes sp. MPI-SDFR-AT-0126]